MNVYILSYNPFSEKIQPSQLLHFIKEGRRIESWYSPFAGTYVLKSTDTIAGMSQMFKGVFETEFHTISQVFPTLMQGSLPPAIWQWIGSTLPISALAQLSGDVPPPPPA